MVHELIGIQDNKVDLRSIGKSSKDQQVALQFPCIVHVFIFIFGIAKKIIFVQFSLTGGCVVIRTRCLFQS
jgi:hypothetical protein